MTRSSLLLFPLLLLLLLNIVASYRVPGGQDPDLLKKAMAKPKPSMIDKTKAATDSLREVRENKQRTRTNAKGPTREGRLGQNVIGDETFEYTHADPTTARSNVTHARTLTHAHTHARTHAHSLTHTHPLT